MERLLTGILAGVLLLGVLPLAALEIPRVFSDHMILQRDRAIPVWGRAQPGSDVTVAYGAARQTVKADADGRFEAALPPHAASAEGKILSVSGDGDTRQFRNVVIGDVWLCAGQSNMQFDLGRATDGAAEDDPAIRLFQVERRWSRTPQSDLKGGWEVCTPQNAKRFSAVAYWFGRRLRRELNVPVGLINISWGGCRIEAMLAPDSPRSAGIAAPVRTRFEQELQAMAAQEEATLRKDKQRLPSVLFHGMIRPWQPFGIRGVLWYQGEDNHSEGMAYAEKLRALADTFRRGFRNENLGLYLVQLPPWQYGEEDSLRIPRFWQAQQYFAEHDPHSGFIVATDCGDPKDIHPKAKRVLAERLATMVLFREYGKGDRTALAPTCAAAQRENRAVRVRFHNPAGLKSRDGKPLTHWELGDGQGRFVPAAARIDGEDVVVVSDAVAQPRKVRFGFHKLANPNLVNRAGVPAAPFEAEVRP